MSRLVVIGCLIGCHALVLPSTTQGQQLTVDLATARDQAAAKVPDTTRVLPATYRIRGIHRVPRFIYTITVSQLPLVIEPLPNPGLKSFADCKDQKLTNAITALKDDTIEGNIPSHLTALRTAMTSADPASCQAALETARLFIVNDTLRYGSFSGAESQERTVQLKTGNYIVVTVTRIDSLGGRPRTWQQVFSGGPRGEWRVTYGFAVPLISGHESFYAKPGGASNIFIITKNQRRSNLGAPLPTLFYTFMPSDQDALSLSPVSGLGFDLTTPTVLLGGTLTYRSNVQVSFGAVVHQESSLLGRYQERDTVPTNLTWDQLSEKVYRVRPYFGVAFRFASNPFSSGSSNAGKEAQPKDAKKPSGTTPADSTKTK